MTRLLLLWTFLLLPFIVCILDFEISSSLKSASCCPQASTAALQNIKGFSLELKVQSKSEQGVYLQVCFSRVVYCYHINAIQSYVYSGPRTLRIKQQLFKI